MHSPSCEVYQGYPDVHCTCRPRQPVKPVRQWTRVMDVSGDWEGYYLNGKLIDQGHSVPADRLLQKVGERVEYREYELEDADDFPESLEKL